MLERAQDILKLDTGDVVRCRDGRKWVCIGWSQAATTPNRSAWFACCLPEDRLLHTHLVGTVWTYNAVFMEALERKFPGITNTYRNTP